MTLLNVIAAFQLVRLAIRWMWHPYAMWHAHVDLGELIVFMGKLADCLILLHYYNQPLPGASFSFHQVFTYAARMISGTIDLSILNDFAKEVNSLAANIQQPSPLNIFQVAVYFIVIGFMALVEAILFAISTLGFIATGVGTLLGPLLVPFLLLPSLAGRFWKWIDFMFVYAFYRVIASAFVFVWVRVIVGFLQNAIHGDYSIPHLLALLVPWLLLQFAFVWSIFQVPHLAHELFAEWAASVQAWAPPYVGQQPGSLAHKRPVYESSTDYFRSGRCGRHAAFSGFGISRPDRTSEPSSALDRGRYRPRHPAPGPGRLQVGKNQLGARCGGSPD